MKKILLLISLVVTIVSCENLQREYPPKGFGVAHIVKKQTRNGVRYGVGTSTPRKNVYKALTPVVFSSYKETADGAAYFLFSEDGKSYYMFDLYGADILSGNTNTSSLDNFVPILNDGKNHKLTEAETYYRHIVRYDFTKEHNLERNGYYIFPTLDGSVYGVICTNGYLSVGPYKQMRFGLKGYMYQDIQTGKFGAKTVADLQATAGYIKEQYPSFDVERQLNKLTPVIFAPEYDEIIEVEVNNKRDIWFARKGDKWLAKEVVKTSKVQDIALDQKLLNRVLKMQPRKEAKWTTNPEALAVVPILAHGQRVGTQEMSIAHVK